MGTGKNSPCSREMAGFRGFWVCWESFVPVGFGGGCCRESFVPAERWIGVGSGKKFSLLARNGRISLIVGVPGEFCTGWGGGAPVMGVGWCCCGRKFSLLGGAVLGTRKNSPCSREMAGFRCFWVCWESFVPVGFGGGCCWESFVPVGPGAAVAGRVLYRVLARAPGGARCRGRTGEGFVPVGSGGGCCRESFVPGEWWIGVGSGKKFSLLGGAVLGTGKNSPCSREMAGFRCFWACRESFVPGGPVRGARWGRVCCVEPR